MNRWSRGGDTPLAQDGDPQPGTAGLAFKGIDMVRDRDKLPPGIVHLAVNKRMRTGSCVKRPGNLQPADFNASFGAKIIGSGIFSDPNGEEWMLVACDGQTWVWKLQAGKDPVKVNLKAGETLAGFFNVRFSQAFDKVLLFRAPIVAGKHTLAWDGDIGTTFDPVDTAHLPGGGGTVIPMTYAGEPFQNRVLLYNPYFGPLPGRDQVLMTDPGDYEQYDNVFGDFRINSAQSDFLVRVWQYFKGTAAIFKHRSIHALENFTSGDPTAASLRTLTNEIGACAIDGITEDGADLLFLNAPNGVYRLSEVIQDQITTAPVPVSEPIQPIIDAINWRAAPGSIAKSYKDYAFFALPIYQSAPRGNNAVGVYNRVTKLWESVDYWEDPNFQIHAMHITNYDGARTLFCLDYINSRVYVMYKLTPDESNGGRWHIRDIVETRGYALGDATSFKRYQRVAIAIATVDPEVHVSAISDGWNEVKDLTPNPITKDRLKFYPHAHPDYDGTTDPNEEKRRDYSTIEFNEVAEDFEGLVEGPIDRLPASAGAYVDAIAQESLERIPIRTNGRWVSLRIENTSGRCDLLAAGVEGIPSTMETRTAA